MAGVRRADPGHHASTVQAFRKHAHAGDPLHPRLNSW